MFNLSDRVRYTGPLKSLSGATGNFIRMYGNSTSQAVVSFLNDHTPERVVMIHNLELENPTMKNFKALVSAALASFDVDGLNPKDDAARRLGVAYELASAGEKAKKAAKKTLKGLGLLADAYPTGTEVIYDSEKFKITADTKEPASVIKVECLQAELQRRGMSGAIIAQIIAASYGTNKPATTLVVVQKEG